MSVTIQRLLLIPITVLGLWSCQTSQMAGMQPATIQSRDVFVCKGLSADNRWVGVTDTFMPDEDTQIVVVAKFDKSDLDGWIIYELTNPQDMVVLTQKFRYPKHNPLGIPFPMDRLLKVGEEGEWRATVYVDEFPIGDSVFYIGEKPGEEEEGEAEYFIVGEDSVDNDSTVPVSLSEEERFSSYIQETTPELEVPLPDTIDPNQYTVIE
jgi:hypothetical protein